MRGLLSLLEERLLLVLRPIFLSVLWAVHIVISNKAVILLQVAVARLVVVVHLCTLERTTFGWLVLLVFGVLENNGFLYHLDVVQHQVVFGLFDGRQVHRVLELLVVRVKSILLHSIIGRFVHFVSGRYIIRSRYRGLLGAKIVSVGGGLHMCHLLARHLLQRVLTLEQLELLVYFTLAEGVLGRVP